MRPTVLANNRALSGQKRQTSHKVALSDKTPQHDAQGTTHT